jgi:hypothetical protein
MLDSGFWILDQQNAKVAKGAQHDIGLIANG